MILMMILIIFMTILMMTIMIDRWVSRPRLKQIMINNDDFDDLDDDNGDFDNFDDDFIVSGHAGEPTEAEAEDNNADASYRI